MRIRDEGIDRLRRYALLRPVGEPLVPRQRQPRKPVGVGGEQLGQRAAGERGAMLFQRVHRRCGLRRAHGSFADARIRCRQNNRLRRGWKLIQSSFDPKVAANGYGCRQGLAAQGGHASAGTSARRRAAGADGRERLRAHRIDPANRDRSAPRLARRRAVDQGRARRVAERAADRANARRRSRVQLFLASGQHRRRRPPEPSPARARDRRLAAAGGQRRTCAGAAARGRHRRIGTARRPRRRRW